ncbi:MAG: hypothetical protein V7776_12435 [Halopseudomonas aestusnigri]
MLKLIRYTFVSALATLMFSQISYAETQSCPERELVKAGTFTVNVKSVGLIIGARWGTGKITLNDGSSKKFTLSGGKILDIGASEKIITGTLYNLDNLDEFPGVYLGIGGGLTAVTKGLGRMSVTNGKCVVMNGGVEGAKGLAVSHPIGPGGAKIEWAE